MKWSFFVVWNEIQIIILNEWWKLTKFLDINNAIFKFLNLHMPQTWQDKLENTASLCTMDTKKYLQRIPDKNMSLSSWSKLLHWRPFPETAKIVLTAINLFCFIYYILCETLLLTNKDCRTKMDDFSENT